MFNRKQDKVVELLPNRDLSGTAESIPLRVDAVREELDRLRTIVDQSEPRITESAQECKTAAQSIDYHARRLLDALSGRES